MNAHHRSHQLWSVLAFAAFNRQILSYALVGRLVGLPAAAVGRDLFPIQYFCHQRGLPPLTVLVVNQITGLPGDGLAVENFAKSIQEVFEFDWLAYNAPGRDVGPKAEDFEQASITQKKERGQAT